MGSAGAEKPTRINLWLLQCYVLSAFQDLEGTLPAFSHMALESEVAQTPSSPMLLSFPPILTSHVILTSGIELCQALYGAMPSPSSRGHLAFLSPVGHSWGLYSGYRPGWDVPGSQGTGLEGQRQAFWVGCFSCCLGSWSGNSHLIVMLTFTDWSSCFILPWT